MNDKMEREINKGGMPLEYFLKHYRGEFSENQGVYIISVEGLAGFRGYYKVGMANSGGISGRLSNLRTGLYPVKDKIRVHAIATKNKGRRLLTEQGSINYAKNAETHIHNEMKLLKWENEGEWYKVPRGELVNLIQIMIEHHYGNDEVSADGGGGAVYIFQPIIFTKVDREEVRPQEMLPLKEKKPRRVNKIVKYTQ